MDRGIFNLSLFFIIFKVYSLFYIQKIVSKLTKEKINMHISAYQAIIPLYLFLIIQNVFFFFNLPEYTNFGCVIKKNGFCPIVLPS